MWLDEAQTKALFIDDINGEQHVKRCRSEVAMAVIDWVMTSVEETATNTEQLGWMLYSADGSDNWIRDVDLWAKNDLVVVNANAFAHVTTRKLHIGYVHRVGFEGQQEYVPGSFEKMEEWQQVFVTYSISNGGSQTMEDCIKTIQEKRRLGRKRNHPVRFQTEQGTAPEQRTNQAKPTAAGTKPVPFRPTPTGTVSVITGGEDTDDEELHENERKKMIARVNK